MKKVFSFIGILLIGALIRGMTSYYIEKGKEEKAWREQQQIIQAKNELDQISKNAGRNLGIDIMRYITEQKPGVKYNKDAVKQKIKYTNEKMQEMKFETLKKLQEVKEKNKSNIEIEPEKLLNQLTQVFEISKPVFYFQIYIIEANKNLNIKYLDKAKEILINSELGLNKELVKKYIDLYKKAIKEYKKNNRISEKTLKQLEKIEIDFNKELEEKSSEKNLIEILKNKNK